MATKQTSSPRSHAGNIGAISSQREPSPSDRMSRNTSTTTALAQPGGSDASIDQTSGATGAQESSSTLGEGNADYGFAGSWPSLPIPALPLSPGKMMAQRLALTSRSSEQQLQQPQTLRQHAPSTERRDDLLFVQDGPEAGGSQADVDQAVVAAAAAGSLVCPFSTSPSTNSSATTTASVREAEHALLLRPHFENGTSGSSSSSSSSSSNSIHGHSPPRYRDGRRRTTPPLIPAAPQSRPSCRGTANVSTQSASVSFTGNPAAAGSAIASNTHVAMNACPVDSKAGGADGKQARALPAAAAIAGTAPAGLGGAARAAASGQSEQVSLPEDIYGAARVSEYWHGVHGLSSLASSYVYDDIWAGDGGLNTSNREDVMGIAASAAGGGGTATQEKGGGGEAVTEAFQAFHPGGRESTAAHPEDGGQQEADEGSSREGEERVEHADQGRRWRRRRPRPGDPGRRGNHGEGTAGRCCRREMEDGATAQAMEPDGAGRSRDGPTSRKRRTPSPDAGREPFFGDGVTAANGAGVTTSSGGVARIGAAGGRRGVGRGRDEGSDMEDDEKSRLIRWCKRVSNPQLSAAGSVSGASSGDEERFFAERVLDPAPRTQPAMAFRRGGWRDLGVDICRSGGDFRAAEDVDVGRRNEFSDGVSPVAQNGDAMALVTSTAWPAAGQASISSVNLESKDVSADQVQRPLESRPEGFPGRCVEGKESSATARSLAGGIAHHHVSEQGADMGGQGGVLPGRSTTPPAYYSAADVTAAADVRSPSSYSRQMAVSPTATATKGQTEGHAAFSHRGSPGLGPDSGSGSGPGLEMQTRSWDASCAWSTTDYDGRRERGDGCWTATQPLPSGYGVVSATEPDSVDWQVQPEAMASFFTNVVGLVPPLVGAGARVAARASASGSDSWHHVAQRPHHRYNSRTPPPASVARPEQFQQFPPPLEAVEFRSCGSSGSGDPQSDADGPGKEYIAAAAATAAATAASIAGTAKAVAGAAAAAAVATALEDEEREEEDDDEEAAEMREAQAEADAAHFGADRTPMSSMAGSDSCSMSYTTDVADQGGEGNIWGW